jgi:hypothetical protein
MHKYIEEFKAGLKMFPNCRDAVESHKNMHFFLHYAHRVASDDLDSDNFEKAFPNFFKYLEVEGEFHNYIEELGKYGG